MGKTVLTPFTVYAEPDVLDRLKRAAEKDRRSLSNFFVEAGIHRADVLGVATPAKGRRSTATTSAARRA